jgi:hypothetical protein
MTKKTTMHATNADPSIDGSSSEDDGTTTTAATATTMTTNCLTSYLRFVSEKLTNIIANSSSTSTTHHNMRRDEVVRPQQLHFVLGNEAGDADSIISALFVLATN